jgi:hypothetical protein
MTFYEAVIRDVFLISYIPDGKEKSSLCKARKS